MASEALSGVRVLELGRSLAAAYCTRQFALWGADVVTVEPAGGSPLRRRRPLKGEVSLLWTYVAAGKRSLSREGLSNTDVLDLAACADVVVADAEVLADLGTTPEAFHAANPGVVLTVNNPFGAEGPYAGLASSELVIQALAGYAHTNGEAGAPPLKAPGHILAYAAGVSACVAALAGLRDRLTGGTGHCIEASEFEAVAAILPLLRGQYLGEHVSRGGGPATGVRALPCADGHITVMPPPPKERPEYEAVLGFSADAWPQFPEDVRPADRQRGVMAFLASYTRARAAGDLFLALMQRGVICGLVPAPDQILAEPHLKARGFWDEFDDPALGRLAMPGPAAHLSRTPAKPGRPAPASSIALADIDWTPRPPAPAARPAKPLRDVRILDATQAWIGPFAAMLLGDLGAEIIKIESHQRPDVWRRFSVHPAPMGQVRADQVNTSPNYNSVNRNKLGVCLNFKHDEACEIFRQLAVQSDLVMENFTPRVMGRYGLDHANLVKLNPRLVMTSFSGYGKTGPLSDFKANGSSIEGVAGWDYFHRYPGGEPLVMGFYQADAISGLQVATATLVALIHQARTGEGQAIDGSMYEAAAGYMGEALLDAQFAGRQTPLGNRDPDMAPNNTYRAAGEDRWVAISVPDDEAWARLTALAPALDQPRFSTTAGRLANEDDLDDALAAWTATQQPQAIMDALQAVGVPAGVVRTPVEILACDHFAARDWFRRITHIETGLQLHNGHPWRFAGVPRTADTASPRLGEHSRAVLKDKLGYSDAKLDELFERDVTGCVALEMTKEEA